MIIRSIIVAIFAVALSGGLFALDLGLDLSAGLLPGGASLVAGVDEHVQVGSELAEAVYAKLELSHSTGVWSSSGFWSAPASSYLPLRSEALATVEYISDLGMAGLTAGLRGTMTRSTFEFGAFADASLPLVGDLLALDAELRVVSDFSGLSGALRVGPFLYLPLDRPVMAGVAFKLGASLGNYENSGYTGPGFLELRPEARISIDRSLALGVSGGYVFDLSGGRFAALAVGPFASLKMSLSLESPRE